MKTRRKVPAPRAFDYSGERPADKIARLDSTRRAKVAVAAFVKVNAGALEKLVSVYADADAQAFLEALREDFWRYLDEWERAAKKGRKP
jgi:hypothetical protein